MLNVYEKCKDTDGILYITYQEQHSFWFTRLITQNIHYHQEYKNQSPHLKVPYYKYTASLNI